jgi:hypothetical protein
VYQSKGGDVFRIQRLPRTLLHPRGRGLCPLRTWQQTDKDAYALTGSSASGQPKLQALCCNSTDVRHGASRGDRGCVPGQIARRGGQGVEPCPCRSPGGRPEAAQRIRRIAFTKTSPYRWCKAERIPQSINSSQSSQWRVVNCSVAPPARSARRRFRLELISQISAAQYAFFSSRCRKYREFFSHKTR